MILDQIAQKTRLRVARDKRQTPDLEIERQAREMSSKTGFPFQGALKKPGLSLICEVKKASPSRGVLRPDFPYLNIAKGYANAGADALSVLTEPDYFQGADSYLAEIASAVPLPTLRKDFILEPYQIYQAKVLGASAVLLICALISQTELAAFIALAGDLGLSALTEVHTLDELHMAVDAGSRLIGVNNRDLQDFSVHLSTSLTLLPKLPPSVIKVSESGIHSAKDAGLLAAAGADALLIGEAVVTKSDPRATISAMKGAAL